MPKSLLENLDHYLEQAASCRKQAASTDLAKERERYNKAAASFERLADMARRVQHKRSSENVDSHAP
ncbi:hypothetical protein SPHINGOAX6_30237 [Sphingomonas sp. AX6]|nr:hypothetical protein SPHINGOAX6_30237 [Sphingomonas sp. AX6]